MSIRFLLSLCFVSIALPLLQAQDEAENKIIAPFSYRLLGKIGKSSLELRLNAGTEQAKTGCIDFYGEYFYEHIGQELPLQGEYCPKKKNLSLVRKDAEGKERERFDFTNFDGKKAKGKWQKLDEKAQNVELSPAPSMDASLFANFVAGDIKKHLDSEAHKFTVEKNNAFQLETQGDYAFAEELNATAYAAGSFVDIWLKRETGEDRYIYQVISNGGKLQICLIELYGDEFEAMNEEEGEEGFKTIYSNTLRCSIFEQQEQSWKPIYQANLYEYEGEDAEQFIHSPILTADMQLFALAQSEGEKTTVHKWQWDGKKMVKK